jgi:uncharacterized protein
MTHSDFPEAEVFELGELKLNNPIIFAGFVGAGLVGPLSVGHIIEKLNMKEIGYMRSKYLPPSTVFIQGRLRHPFRFYSNNDGTICAIICEITLRMEGLYALVSAILDWAKQKGSNEIIILDGVASDEHDDKAYCAAEEDLCRVMADKEISMIPQGFITGIPGGILNECLLREIQGLTLLVKANKDGVDPIAAATLVEAVNRLYETKIDTEDLRKEKEQIGVDFKELSDRYAEHREELSGMYM